MQRFRHILRTCLILALIPLTVLSGRVAPGCICSDGHFELLCRGRRCDSDAPRDAWSCCGSGNCCRSQSAAGAVKPCCAHERQPGCFTVFSDRDCSGGCCHPLTLSPMVAEKDLIPQFDARQLEFDACVTEVLLPAVVEQVVSVPVVDSEPPGQRLKLIQSLLI